MGVASCKRLSGIQMFSCGLDGCDIAKGNNLYCKIQRKRDKFVFLHRRYLPMRAQRISCAKHISYCLQQNFTCRKANIMEKSTPKRAFSGDPDENRTRVTAVKGPCLNRLTTGPALMQKHQKRKRRMKVRLVGSGNWTRTSDTPGMNRMLYQLSYAAK